MLITVLCLIASLLILLGAICFLIYRMAFYYPENRRVTPAAFLRREKIQPFLATAEHFFAEIDKYPCERVSITSADGLTLSARFFPTDPKGPYAILMHGYKGTAEGDCSPMAVILREAGFNLLLPDQRATGKSGGHKITFGVRERLDILFWTGYLNRRFGATIRILWGGVSLGASTCLMASGERVPATVKCILADCGYTSPREILLYQAKKYHKCFPLFAPLLALSARLYAGFSLRESTAVRALEKNTLPVLLIHGDMDEVVPISMMDALYASSAGHAEKLIMRNCGHALSGYTDFPRYRDAILDFLKRNFGMKASAASEPEDNRIMDTNK